MKERTYNGRRIYFKAYEVAEMVDVKTVTVYDWCTKGKIPCVKVGGSVRIPIERFLNWLEDHTMEPK